MIRVMSVQPSVKNLAMPNQRSRVLIAPHPQQKIPSDSVYSGAHIVKDSILKTGSR